MDLQSLNATKIAVLFSGGMDSEAALICCRDIGVPYYAVFCLYTFKGLPVNIHEQYYVEKYCTENQVELRIIKLDLEWFFGKDKYLKYVQKYYCNVAQICPYHWFVEQMTDVCVLGGDSPHVLSREPYVFHPPMLGQISVERMFAVDKIPGIPNLLTYSKSTLDHALGLWELDIKEDPYTYNTSGTKQFSRWAYATMKHQMYHNGGLEMEIKPKFSSPFALCADFDIKKYDIVARKIIG